MELRIKEIDSQALKYSRELEAYDQGKNSGSDQFTPDGFCSKSLPFSSRYNAKKAMKRRKRKRVEDTTDLTSYMLQHNFFSYLGETKHTGFQVSSQKEILFLTLACDILQKTRGQIPIALCWLMSLVMQVIACLDLSS